SKGFSAIFSHVPRATAPPSANWGAWKRPPRDVRKKLERRAKDSRSAGEEISLAGNRCLPAGNQALCEPRPVAGPAAREGGSSDGEKSDLRGSGCGHVVPGLVRPRSGQLCRNDGRVVQGFGQEQRTGRIRDRS